MGHRALDCPFYDDCLKHAADSHWDGFSCGACRLVDDEQTIDVAEYLGSAPNLEAGDGRLRLRTLVTIPGQKHAARACRYVDLCPCCGKPVNARGLCKPHYNQWLKAHKAGLAPDDAVAWAVAQFGLADEIPEIHLCSEPGCGRAAVALGLCMTHYSKRWRAQRATRTEADACSTPT